MVPIQEMFKYTKEKGKIPSKWLQFGADLRNFHVGIYFGASLRKIFYIFFLFQFGVNLRSFGAENQNGVSLRKKWCKFNNKPSTPPSW